jgi:hypothetical protein
VQRLRPPAPGRGVNRAVWNLRYEDLPLRGGGDDDGPAASSTPGPLVMPGTYVVRLTSGDVTEEQKVEVREDPRIDARTAGRRAWTDFQMRTADVVRQVVPLNERVQKIEGNSAELADLNRQTRELQARLSTLYGQVERWTGPPTASQESELKYYTKMAAALSDRAAAIR